MEAMAREATFYDPFAAEGAPAFDPLASMRQIQERYQNKEVEPDYTADKFVADAEALAADSHFNGMMEQMLLIEQAMHDMCGDHDPALQNSVQKSSFFGRNNEQDDHNNHATHAGHKHAGGGHDHNNGKPESGKKKRRTYEGMLAMLLRIWKTKTKKRS